MQELLNVNADSQTVSARELHGKLNIGTEFAKWFSRMCEYGFSREIDYSEVIVKNDENSKGGRPATDYDISVDMAKQICMIQRTPEGKAVRQYLIDLEKAWNSPEQVFARALKMADATIAKLKGDCATLIADNERMKPKEIFADAVSTSHTSILIGDLAKLICQNGYQIGQKRLFEWMRNRGYLKSRRVMFRIRMVRSVLPRLRRLRVKGRCISLISFWMKERVRDEIQIHKFAF